MRRERSKWILAWAVGTASTLGVSCAEGVPDSATAVKPAEGSASQILNAVNSSRVTELSQGANSVALVSGQATSAPGDSARTIWYETIAGAAYANANGLNQVTRVVLDSSGVTLDSQTDPAATVALDPFAPLVLSSSDVQSGAAQGAQAVDAKIVDVHYIPLFKGAAELVVQPNDAGKFLPSAASNVGTLLVKTGLDSQDYLVTVVDASGETQLVLGFVKGVGGDNGQGIGWTAPGINTDAVWGQPFVAE